MIYVTEYEHDDGLIYQAEVEVDTDSYGSLKAKVESCSTFDVEGREQVLKVEDVPLDVTECLVMDAMNHYDESDVVRFLECEHADLDNKFRRGG
jgi:hypothetical protein